MDKKNQTEYLSDQELEELIAQVENEDLLAAPTRLKGDILLAIDMEEHAVTRKKKRTKRQRLLSYSAKVVMASAAALFLLIVMPSEFNKSGKGIYGGIQVFSSINQQFNEKSNKITEKLFEYSYKQDLKEDDINDEKEK